MAPFEESVRVFSERKEVRQEREGEEECIVSP